ncbi:MAG: carbohydrate kinase family protein [Nanoarchaeota archaeon]
MFNYNVLCIGSATVDNFLTIDKPLSSVKLGDKVLVRHLEKHCGGGGTNSAAALSKLGLKVKVLSKLGSDHEAEFIVKELKKYKVKNICRNRSRKSTDLATIISSPYDSDRIIYVHKGASEDLSVKDYNKSSLSADWIYMASLVGKSFSAGKEIAAYAEHEKKKLLFNPSYYLAEKGKKALQPILRATEILVLNKEEAEALLGFHSNNIKKLLKGLQHRGPKIVVITNGKRGVYALHENTIYSLLPPKIKVVNAAGAGDAFTSGFLFGLIKNYLFADALCLGQVNASSVIQHIGAKRGLLTEKEAVGLMKKYKIKINAKKV